MDRPILTVQTQKKLVSFENLPTDFGFEAGSEVFIMPMTWIPSTNRLLIFPYATDYSNYGPHHDPLNWIDTETGEMGEFLSKGAGGLGGFLSRSNQIFRSGQIPIFLGRFGKPGTSLSSGHSQIWNTSAPGSRIRSGHKQTSSHLLVAIPSSVASPTKDFTVPARSQFGISPLMEKIREKSRP